MLVSKKLTSLMAGVFVIMALAGCEYKVANTFKEADNEAKKETKRNKFGSTYMELNNPFFVELNNSIQEVIEHKGDSLITLDSAKDQAKQISQVEDLISQNVSAIFLNPVDWKGVKPVLDAARAAGVPVINVDAPVFDTDLVACIVESDNYSAGKLVFEDVSKRLKGGSVVLLEHPTAKSAIDRTKAFEDAIQGKTEWMIVAKQTSDGQLEKAMPAMENVLQLQKKIDVVYGLNDPTAMGALAALQAANRDKGVLIYGVDGAPDAKKMVKEGRLTGTAAQSPKGLGKTAAVMAYKILAGENIEKHITVPVILITKENVDKYGTTGWQ